MDISLLIFVGVIALIVAFVYSFRQIQSAKAPRADPYLIPSYPQSGAQPHWLKGDGSFELAVVGEANYQRAFEQMCGPRKPEGEDVEVDAQLSLEDANRFDSNAVKVEVQGRTVGYLSRDDASDFREWLKAEGISARQFTCKANIRGGWDRDGNRGHYGIWLDVDLFGDEG
jgi:hypothetical protein